MKLEGYRVCLEAGHGYHDTFEYDPGAVAHGCEEHKLNVAQVEHVAKLLEAQGCKVTKVICRSQNGLSLGKRGLQAAGHDLFLSFHHNAANGKAQGTEVLMHLMGTLSDAGFATALSKRIALALGYFDRGMKKQNLGVLRLVPKDVKAAVLVESYFLDNTALAGKDLEALSLKAADAAAEGIADFLIANCKRRKTVIVEPKKVDIGASEPKKIELPKMPWKKG
jgi:N-acetylmuramoyl-L-alanine amidase